MQEPLTHRPSPGDGDAGRQVKDAAKASGREAKVAVKKEASSFAEKARDQAEAKKDKGAATLGDFAEAIRRAADELRERDQSMGAQLAQQAADGLAGLSRSLANKSPEDMLRSAREFGRQNPSAFFAASVVAGVALGRFAGASSDHGRSSDHASAGSGEQAETTRRSTFEGATGATSAARPEDGEFNVVTARHDPPGGQGPRTIPTGSPTRPDSFQDNGGVRG